MSECYFTRENQWYRMHKFHFFLFLNVQFLCQILAVNFLLTHFTNKNLLETKFVASKSFGVKIPSKLSIFDRNSELELALP